MAGAGGSVVALGFLGNIFFPLSGVLLDVARWTPLYGYASLARYPLTEGTLYAADGTVSSEALWVPLVNVAGWWAVLALVAVLGIGLWVGPRLVDWEPYRARLAGLAGFQLGRPVTLDGPITLVLLPQPRLARSLRASSSSIALEIIRTGLDKEAGG